MFIFKNQEINYQSKICSVFGKSWIGRKVLIKHICIINFEKKLPKKVVFSEIRSVVPNDSQSTPTRAGSHSSSEPGQNPKTGFIDISITTGPFQFLFCSFVVLMSTSIPENMSPNG